MIESVTHPNRKATLMGVVFLFVVCIASRLLTSIYYIEDPDSLRFALGVVEYDVTALRPHFPGYPIFCWLTSVLYAISGSLGFSFGLMGGLALFGGVIFSVKIAETLKLPIHPWMLSALLLVNPLIWLMSNRYMPDLLGLTVLLGSVWLFLRAFLTDDKKSLFLFFLLAGILPGIRLSYLPFLLVPVIVLVVKNWKQFWAPLAGVMGVAVWLVPLILITGWDALIEAAQTHTSGHFGEWGGTVQTDPQYFTRLGKILETIWADGMGGWMPGRHWWTAVLSLALIIALFWGGRTVYRIMKSKEEGLRGLWQQPRFRALVWILASMLVYAIWIYFFQNVLYKSRHILPFLPFLVLLVCTLFPGWNQGEDAQKQKGVGFGLVLAVIIPSLIITLQLAIQHKQPSAIAQSQRFLKETIQEPSSFVSIPLINEYLAAQENEYLEFFEVNAEAEVKRQFETGKPLWSNRKLDGILGRRPYAAHTFYHNPYVNRLWPVITLYEYRKD